MYPKPIVPLQIDRSKGARRGAPSRRARCGSGELRCGLRGCGWVRYGEKPLVEPGDDEVESCLAIEVAKERVVSVGHEVENLLVTAGVLDELGGGCGVGQEVGGAVHGEERNLDLVVLAAKGGTEGRGGGQELCGYAGDVGVGGVVVDE